MLLLLRTACSPKHLSQRTQNRQRNTRNLCSPLLLLHRLSLLRPGLQPPHRQQLNRWQPPLQVGCPCLVRSSRQQPSRCCKKSLQLCVPSVRQKKRRPPKQPQAGLTRHHLPPLSRSPHAQVPRPLLPCPPTHSSIAQILRSNCRSPMPPGGEDFARPLCRNCFLWISTVKYSAPKPPSNSPYPTDHGYTTAPLRTHALRLSSGN